MNRTAEQRAKTWWVKEKNDFGNNFQKFTPIIWRCWASSITLVHVSSSSSVDIYSNKYESNVQA